MPYPGFPRGVRCTAVPDPLLGSLLEQISDVTELKVCLRGIWLLQQHRGSAPQARVEELLSDGVLLNGLKTDLESAQSQVLKAFRATVERGVFLWMGKDRAYMERGIFSLNTETGRRAFARSGVGKELAGSQQLSNPIAPAVSEVKPNIFALYEDNIGTISPLLAEELREAEQEFSWAWIEEAFKIAVTQNKRSWGYISAILHRWAAEGRDEGKEHGKSGRHPQEDSSRKYIEEFQRRRGHLPWEEPGKTGRPTG